MARRIQQQPLFVLIVAVVFVCSLWVIFARLPERMTAVSQDGLLSVEGVSRDAQGILLETVDASTGQYTLSIEGSSLIYDVVLSFPAQEPSTQEVSLLLFDRAQNKWIKERCLYDKQEKRYLVRLDTLGSTVIQRTIPE